MARMAVELTLLLYVLGKITRSQIWSGNSISFQVTSLRRAGGYPDSQLHADGERSQSRSKITDEVVALDTGNFLHASRRTLIGSAGFRARSASSNLAFRHD